MSEMVRNKRRAMMLERWHVSVAELPIRTLFREFNIDVRSGSAPVKIVNAAFRCLDIEMKRDDYKMQWGADFVRLTLYNGGTIECQKVRQ